MRQQKPGTTMMCAGRFEKEIMLAVIFLPLGIYPFWLVRHGKSQQNDQVLVLSLGSNNNKPFTTWWVNKNWDGPGNGGSYCFTNMDVATNPGSEAFPALQSSESKKPSGDLFCNTLHIPKSHTITGFEVNPIYQITVANIEAPTFPPHHVVVAQNWVPPILDALLSR